MTADEDYFWELATSLLRDPRISRSTMMGLPCLRCDGAFFASLDRRSGELIVKLPEARVKELVAAGTAVTFAPAGRPFRRWAAIRAAERHFWAGYLDEAKTFAAERTNG